MILAIISAVVCFSASVLIFTPHLRKISLLRPLAYYLFFEGVWQLLSYIILQVDPTNGFIANINYIGTILIIGFYIFLLLKAHLKSAKANKKQEKAERKV